MKVKGFFEDIKGPSNILEIRKEKIKNASPKPVTKDPINELAKKIHPDKVYLTIDSVEQTTATSRTYRFVKSNKYGEDAPEIPIFQAGQYISFKFQIGESWVTRPYFISSAPYQVLENRSKKPFVEVSIRKKDGGFVTEYIWENWKPGTEVMASMAHGQFYYEPLRDADTIVALAGGSGITPFHSMAREICNGKLEAKLILIYGSNFKKEFMFYKEFIDFEKNHPDKIKFVPVLSGEEKGWDGETGFITKDIIKKYTDINNSTFFICGPQVMYKFVEKELNNLKIPRKRIRREVFGEMPDIYSMDDFPNSAKNKKYSIKVHIGKSIVDIEASSSESVLVALERNGIKNDSHCRSGECGFCRSQLLKGEIYVSPENDGRREADKIYGYFHPCSSYPISSLEIRISLA
ncbi:2Fe-2S iron-sulfur cluster-binding protein [Anaerosalibacter bizertensis]|uniref:2Fe-2S iron-sulfur cluster-binding protein n=1 Tax=Anaerosalibacter bizertensis TaxID=932217 RepID=UPI0035170452